MKVVVKVTSKHIKKGRPGCTNFCPVACALADAGFLDPTVPGRGKPLKIKLNKKDESIQVPCPQKVNEFVEKFDRYGHGYADVTYKPFQFKINIP